MGFYQQAADVYWPKAIIRVQMPVPSGLISFRGFSLISKDIQISCINRFYGSFYCSVAHKLMNLFFFISQKVDLLREFTIRFYWMLLQKIVIFRSGNRAALYFDYSYNLKQVVC